MGDQRPAVLRTRTVPSSATSSRRRSAQRREGRGTSAGRIEAPTGTRTGVRRSPLIHAETCSMPSAYSRAEDAAVPVNQYTLTWSRTCSNVDPDGSGPGWSSGRGPRGSVQVSSFSHPGAQPDRGVHQGVAGGLRGGAVHLRVRRGRPPSLGHLRQRGALDVGELGIGRLGGDGAGVASGPPVGRRPRRQTCRMAIHRGTQLQQLSPGQPW